jgi:hypothetical protein
LRAGGHALPGDAPGNPKPNAKRPPDGLRSHFVMMVAAPVGDPLSTGFRQAAVAPKRHRQ